MPEKSADSSLNPSFLIAEIAAGRTTGGEGADSGYRKVNVGEEYAGEPEIKELTENLRENYPDLMDPRYK
ncbi:MAG: hypothetical protein JXD23_13980 [Spirochaetales bacterium]|nr:hypothetical protein [Spirochaetales bacterium]